MTPRMRYELAWHWRSFKENWPFAVFPFIGAFALFAYLLGLFQ